MNACTVRCSRDRHAHFEHQHAPCRHVDRYECGVWRFAETHHLVLAFSGFPSARIPPMPVSPLCRAGPFRPIGLIGDLPDSSLTCVSRRMIASRSYVMASPTATSRFATSKTSSSKCWSACVVRMIGSVAALSELSSQTDPQSRRGPWPTSSCRRRWRRWSSGP